MPRYSGHEKRRYKRLAIALQVKYRFGQVAPLHKAHTIDISAGGMCLGPVSLSNEWMLGKCHVELEIILPEAPHPVNAVAEVVRVESAKPHHVHHRCRHIIRLRFCHISEQDRRAIDEFVKSKGIKLIV